ncbi:hypothetical protein KA005_76645, partial [bacterium]|nr:hypothetical protein [bacterium]
MKYKIYKIRITHVVLITLILIGILGLSIPSSVKATRVTGEVVWEDMIIISEVGPEQDGIFVYPGILIINMSGVGSNVQEVIMNLYVSVDQAWNVNVTPNEFIFKESGSEPFNITVWIPAGTSYYTSAELIVSGTVTNNPGLTTYSMQTVTGTIKTNQYYLFSINCSEHNKNIMPGEKITYNFDIINKGNARDMFQINVTNTDELKAEGFIVKLSSDEIEIREKGSAAIELNLTALSTSNDFRTYEIKLKIFSCQAQLNNEKPCAQNYTLTAELILNDQDSPWNLFEAGGLFGAGKIFNVDILY